MKFTGAHCSMYIGCFFMIHFVCKYNLYGLMLICTLLIAEQWKRVREDIVMI